MEKMFVKSLNREVEIKEITFGDAKKIGLTKILFKLQKEEQLDDETIDKVISIVIPDEEDRNKLSYSEVMDIFYKVMEATQGSEEEKKQ